MANRHKQSGVMLLEALVGIIIFSIGVLALIALQARAISTQADSQYRIEASNLADQVVGQIALNVNRTSDAALQTSLAAFSHQTTNSGACNFSGTASASTIVTTWVNDVTARLPGAATRMLQITVNTGNFNQVAVTVCWQSPADAAPRRHTIISHIN